MKDFLETRLGWIACGLIAVTIWLFWPVTQFGLVNWDDDLYVHLARQHAPLSLAAVRWAFTTLVPFYYHPLTWLTHIADAQVWGGNLTGHHLGNVLLHAANAGLVFVLGMLLLGKLDTLSDRARLVIATLVALVFALHPLQVESVAWVAERKNLLCALFGLGSMCAYVLALAGSRRDGRWWWTAFGCFVAALLSKPMAVSLPVVMLALDAFPLRRHEERGWWPLVQQKWLWWVAATAVGVLTMIGQHQWGAVKELQDLGALERLVVATRAVTFYLWKFAWPAWLSPYYPLGANLHLGQAEFAVPAAVFVAISTAGWRLRHRMPGLLAGWVAYLALIAPTSGLVQAGPQAAADRFMYLAIVPVALVVAGGGLLVWRGCSMAGRGALAILAVALLGFYCVQTVRHLPAWQSEETMWRAVLRHFPQSGIANFHLAMALVDQSRFEEALPHARYAVTIIPDNPLAQSTLGVALLKTRHYEEAIAPLQAAIAAQPDYFGARYNLACAFSRLGRWADAYAALQELLQRSPAHGRLAARDAELAGLREHPEYRERVAALLSGAP